MIQSSVTPESRRAQGADISKARVVVLNNFIGPHHCKVLQAAQKRVGKLTVLLSTPMETNRDWLPIWGDLDVQVQKNLTITRKWRHRAGFADDNYIHIPWDTKKRLAALKPDVILSYEMGMRTWFSSRYRAHYPDCVLVMVGNMSEHTERCRGRLRPKFRKHLKKRIDLATFNGPSCKAYLSQLGFEEDQLLHYPYIHDADVVFTGPRNEFPELPSRLFYCGSLIERKGIEGFCRRLINWAQKHPDRNVTLSMAGRGPLEDNLKSMERPKNLEFEFLGPIPPDDLARHYQESDISVFPTLADEWGLVVTEAMASGLPVLASRYGQAVTTLCNEENSWTFSPDDDDEYDAAIDASLSSTAGQRRNMCENARQTVAYITAEFGADNFERIIERALKLKAARTSKL